MTLILRNTDLILVSMHVSIQKNIVLDFIDGLLPTRSMIGFAVTDTTKLTEKSEDSMVGCAISEIGRKNIIIG